MTAGIEAPQVPELGPDGSEVTLTGRPVELCTSLNKVGYPMATVVLDATPDWVVLVPPELFERAGSLLIGRHPVTVRGRVDARDDVPHDVLATGVTAVPAVQGEGGLALGKETPRSIGRVLGDVVARFEGADDSLLEWHRCDGCRQPDEPCPCAGANYAVRELVDVVAALVAQARTEGEKKDRERLLEIARQDRRDSASYWAEQFAQAAELDDPGPRVTELARALRTQP